MKSWVGALILAVWLGVAGTAAQDRVLVLDASPGSLTIFALAAVQSRHRSVEAPHPSTNVGPIVPGLSLHEEMQMLADTGIQPMKAIQGATLWAAEVIGRDKDLGSVEPGKLADFTVIEGNPLADIRATTQVRMVIKGGEVMETAYDPKWVNPIPRPSGNGR